MKVVFFGSGDFAISSLEAITGSGHKVLTVVTQPDRKGGRHLKLTPPPVKVAASLANIAVYQPELASESASIEHLKALGADVFVVVSFGQILSAELLKVPRKCSINLHGSLLPRYRGAAPVNYAIINGDKKSGVTVIKMSPQMDAGEMILHAETDIKGIDTSISLGERLADIGAKLVVESLDLIEQDKAAFTAQDEKAVSYAPKLKKSDGLIDWKKPANAVRNLARGLQPWPGAYTHLDGKMLKIYNAEVVDRPASGEFKPGQIVEVVREEGIIVKAGKMCLFVKSLQIEGKRIVDAAAFLRGHKLKPGATLS
ncbi:methionyl-tRNA formyltransferase [Candidatus Omnitrophota bacterium]